MCINKLFTICKCGGNQCCHTRRRSRRGIFIVHMFLRSGTLFSVFNSSICIQRVVRPLAISVCSRESLLSFYPQHNRWGHNDNSEELTGNQQLDQSNLIRVHWIRSLRKEFPHFWQLGKFQHLWQQELPYLKMNVKVVTGGLLPRYSEYLHN